MSVREKMKQWREQRGIDIRMAARGCGISARLLSMLEEGEVSAPGIVERVAAYYGLSDLEAEELLPVCRRPHLSELSSGKKARFIATVQHKKKGEF